jgi:predicted transposase YbfD/YdcC
MRTTEPKHVDVLADFAEYFDELDDPRLAVRTRHRLLDVVMIALLGVFCGADGWADLAQFAKIKYDFLVELLALPHGVPSKNTFRRVFESIAASAFRRCFTRWADAMVGSLAGKHLALDGKTLRGSMAHAEAEPLHLVHAWVVENRMLLAQQPGEGKGQELDSLRELVRVLSLKGATVTIDALGCQPEIADAVDSQGGEYLLCVKNNQPSLCEEVTQFLLDARTEGMAEVEHSYHRTEETGHGRHEVREAWVVQEVEDCPVASSWAGCQSLVMIERTRRMGEDVETETHVYISNANKLSAERALLLSRGLWQVENGLHWALDISMGEDQSRIHMQNGAENFALIRRMALNALKRDKAIKLGLRGKRKVCGWDNKHLLSMLSLLRSKDANATNF